MGTAFVVGVAGIGKSAVVSAALPRPVNFGRGIPEPVPGVGILVEIARDLVRREADPQRRSLRLHRHALAALRNIP
ncbi:hypothetical protein ACWDTI_24070 [Gordonia sp. NPDC003424]